VKAHGLSDRAAELVLDMNADDLFERSLRHKSKRARTRRIDLARDAVDCERPRGILKRGEDATMAKGDFISDVQEIRRRARQHIERGAMRSAPSRRIVSPFSIGFSTM